MPAYAPWDFVSDFSLPTTQGESIKLGDTVGVPVVLLLLGELACATSPQGRAVYESFVERVPELGALQATVRAIVRGPVQPSSPGDAGAASLSAGPISILIDADGRVSALYDAQQPRVALLHPNGRIARYYSDIESSNVAQQVLEDVRQIQCQEKPREVLQQAPILLIPHVLPLDFCEELMQIWETQGNDDSGFMKEVEGKTVGQYDYKAKIRRDHFIRNGSPHHVRARDFIVKHVIGEINKAFNFEVTRLEEMKIACYDASRGGYFRPHRDNTTSATAHRRFAASILLNDEYEGGHLRFPEYGPHLYRPAAGGAAVFGCSLLHEATDVTAGRRFVLLTFLYGEREAKVREEYAKRSGGGYRA